MTEWQPIETAPRDGTPVILGAPGAGSGEAYFDSDVDRWYWANTYSTDATDGEVPIEYVHWMPLPEPPK